jgi:hypothetical protein
MANRRQVTPYVNTPILGENTVAKTIGQVVKILNTYPAPLKIPADCRIAAIAPNIPPVASLTVFVY